MSFYFFYKIRKQEGRTDPVWGGVVSMGEGRGWEKV
jgi:hypothetical protein